MFRRITSLQGFFLLQSVVKRGDGIINTTEYARGLNNQLFYRQGFTADMFFGTLPNACLVKNFHKSHLLGKQRTHKYIGISTKLYVHFECVLIFFICRIFFRMWLFKALDNVLFLVLSFIYSDTLRLCFFSISNYPHTSLV